MKRLIIVTVALVLGISGWMLFDNRRREIAEGVSPSDIAWDLGWYPDRESDDGMCLHLQPAGDNPTTSLRFCGAGNTPAAGETVDPLLGHLFIGWVPESEVKAGVEGEVYVSPPLGAFDGQRAFIVFIESAEFPIEDATVNGRPVTNS